MKPANNLKVIHPGTGRIVELQSTETQPQPLASKPTYPTYPVGALGELLGGAAKALAHHVQVPMGMAAQSVLAVASLVVQGQLNIRKGGIGVSPVSLYCMTIAGSGERKSSVDTLAMKPVYEYQAKRRQDYASLLAEYTACMEAHNQAYQSIINSYKKQAKSRALQQREQEALAYDLGELEKAKPKLPPRPHILMEEPTAEGIYKHFLEADTIAGLFSDEGGAFFSGHGMSDEAKGRTITMLSQLWDGKPITRTRGSAGESGVRAGMRLSAHLMVQPIIANKVLADPLMAGQGFLARFLVAQDEPLVGQRLLKDRPESEGPSHCPALQTFWKKLEDLLADELAVNESGELEPTEMVITGKAYSSWVLVHDEIEKQLSPHGELATIKEFAAKAADNIARIAAVLTYLESGSNPEEAEIFRAAQLMNYYLKVMLQRSESAVQSQLEQEAAELKHWIMENHGGHICSADFKKLPSAYRKAIKARQLLTLLVDYGHANVTGVEGKKNRPREWAMIAETNV